MQALILRTIVAEETKVHNVFSQYFGTSFHCAASGSIGKEDKITNQNNTFLGG